MKCLVGRKASSMQLISEQINSDLVGITIERLTGQKLGTYVREHVLQPLGIKDSAFLCSPEMKDNLTPMHFRGEDGLVQEGPFVFDQAINSGSEDEMFHGGSGGMYGSVPDYMG